MPIKLKKTSSTSVVTGNSVQFNGSTQYLSGTGSLVTGSTSFTAEAWIYLTSNIPNGGNGGIVGSNYQSFSPVGWSLRLNNSGNNVVSFMENWGTNNFNSNTTISLNTWYHIAAVRSGSVANIFINGVKDTSVGTFNSTYNSTAFVIGRTYTNANIEYFPGYISNVRVVSGAALYTASFTPPTAPLTAIANTALLTCQSATIIDNSTNNFTITNNNGATVSSAITPFSSSLALGGTNFKKSLYPVVGSIGGTNMKKAAIQIVSSNLVLNLDAGNISSYPGTGANWYDLSGNNTASLVNSPTYTSSFGGNFILNGSGQYASVSNVYNFATSNQFTAIIWAKSAVSLWNDYGFLVSRRDQFIIHPILNTKDVNYYISTTSGYASVTYTVPDITKFAQYAMTYNAGALEVYHNGVRVTGATIATTLSSDTGVIEIGKDETWARYLNGNVSAVQLYNRALSASEVTQNYNALKSRFGL